MHRHSQSIATILLLRLGGRMLSFFFGYWRARFWLKKKKLGRLMVCDKCEKKLGRVIVPDKWKEGARNTIGGKHGGVEIGKSGALRKKRTLAKR